MKLIVPVAMLVALHLPPMALEAQTLLPPGRQPAGPDSNVLVRGQASGSLRQLVSGGSSETSSADGSMGVALEWPHRSLTAAINVATSAAPLTAKFAESLLTPASGAGFQSGLVDFRADRVHLPKILLRLPAFGVHAYASASSRVWQSLSDTAGHQKATILGLGAMAFTRAEFVSADTANRVSIAGELGFSARHISGDLGQDRELRMALLQTDRRWFYGLEGGLTISINKITAAMQVYYYFHRIQGIGSCQMTTGLSLQADLFSFRNHPTVNRRTAGI